MRRALLAVATLGLVILLAGCARGMSTETMQEIGKARDTCSKLDGRFVQWETESGEKWRCDFNDPEKGDQ